MITGGWILFVTALLTGVGWACYHLGHMHGTVPNSIASTQDLQILQVENAKLRRSVQLAQQRISQLEITILENRKELDELLECRELLDRIRELMDSNLPLGMSRSEK